MDALWRGNTVNRPGVLAAKLLMLAVLFSTLLIPATAGAQKEGPVKGGSKTPSSKVETAAANSLAWPRYGVDVAWATSPEIVTALRTAGTQSIRVQIKWLDIEPTPTTPDKFQWGSTDALLGRLSGLDVLAVIDFCPSWACDDQSGPLKSGMLSRFTQFAAALAQRHSVAPYLVHRWEFWNEPDSTTGSNGSLGWGKHGDMYAAMLAAAVPAMRAADAHLVVANGGIGYDWFTNDSPAGPFYRSPLSPDRAIPQEVTTRSSAVL